MIAGQIGVAASLMLFSLLWQATSARAGDCDSSVLPISAPPQLAYQSRGGYCEGLYLQPISSTGLQIVGFHTTTVTIDPAASAARVEVMNHDGPKRLRVRSIRPRQYYLLDAEFEGSSFEYDLAVSRTPDIALASDDLALRVCVQHCDSLEPTLIGARLSSAENDPGRHYLMFQATVDLVSLRVRIRDADSDEVLLDREYLEDGTLSAWAAPRLDIEPFVEQSRELTVSAFAKGFDSGTPDSVTARLLVR